jgi:hypothetical protein
MSRFILKTAAVFLLSAGAALAHAPDPAPAAAMPAATSFNAAAYPFGATSIPKTFTGGRFAENGVTKTVQAAAPDSQANMPAGM